MQQRCYPHQPTLRELLNQLVNTFKHSFDSKVHAHAPSCQREEVANAKLSQFEKTYVSFPEFIDIDTGAGRTLYDNGNVDKKGQWSQLAC